MATEKTKNKIFRAFLCEYYLYNLFNYMGFIYPFIALMFSEKGLNATQIAMIIICSKIAQIITGVPSGILSDKFNRKYILISAGMVKMSVYFFWIRYPNFFGYLIGYILFGLNGSLAYSCNEAFLYDRLLKYYRKYLFERIKGRVEFTASLGVFIAGFSSVYLIRYGYNMLMILSALSIFISIMFLILIKPIKKIVDVDKSRNLLSYLDILRRGIKYIFYKRTALFKLMMFIAFSNSITIAQFEYIGIFFNETTKNLTKVAFFFALIEIVYALGGLCAEFFKKLSKKWLFFIYFLTSCLSIIAYYIYSYPISIIMIIIIVFILCIIYINFISRINNLIPSNIRATTIAIRDFFEGIGSLVVLYLFGFIVDYYNSYRIGFLVSNIVNAIGALIFFLIFLSRKKARK